MIGFISKVFWNFNTILTTFNIFFAVILPLSLDFSSSSASYRDPKVIKRLIYLVFILSGVRRQRWEANKYFMLKSSTCTCTLCKSDDIVRNDFHLHIPKIGKFKLFPSSLGVSMHQRPQHRMWRFSRGNTTTVSRDLINLTLCCLLSSLNRD